MITLQMFEERLDRWGGLLERWPPQERAEAEALLAVSAAARGRHALMRDIEAALALPSAEFPAAERVAARATGRPQQKRTPPALRRAGWGAAAAVALVLGILAGGADVGTLHEDGPDNVLASALDASMGNADVD